jgi:hypothetical protein
MSLQHAIHKEIIMALFAIMEIEKQIRLVLRPKRKVLS